MKKITLIVIFIRLGVTVGIFVAFLAWGHAAAVAANRTPQEEQVIHITAKKFAYSPSQIVLKKGQPIILELTSLDRVHGFRSEELGIRADVKPGETTRVRLVPQQTGNFAFACDVFCGVNHEEMAGEIIVVE